MYGKRRENTATDKILKSLNIKNFTLRSMHNQMLKVHRDYISVGDTSMTIEIV